MANTQLEIKKSGVPSAAVSGRDVFHSMRHEMDRLFDRFSMFDIGQFGRFPAIEHFWPRGNGGSVLSVLVDVAEGDKAYTITAELPGIDEKNIDVNLSDDVLTLKGEMRTEREEKNKTHYASERSYGSFGRSFALPADVDVDKIGAKFDKGVLTVTLPKTTRAHAATKKIEVKTA